LFCGEINILLIVLHRFIKFISIISEESSNKTTHICAYNNKKKKADVEDEFDEKIMCCLKFDCEINHQERYSNDKKKIDREIYKQNCLYSHKL